MTDGTTFSDVATAEETIRAVIAWFESSPDADKEHVVTSVTHIVRPLKDLVYTMSQHTKDNKVVIPIDDEPMTVGKLRRILLEFDIDKEVTLHNTGTESNTTVMDVSSITIWDHYQYGES